MYLPLPFFNIYILLFFVLILSTFMNSVSFSIQHIFWFCVTTEWEIYMNSTIRVKHFLLTGFFVFPVTVVLASHCFWYWISSGSKVVDTINIVLTLAQVVLVNFFLSLILSSIQILAATVNDSYCCSFCCVILYCSLTLFSFPLTRYYFTFFPSWICCMWTGTTILFRLT